jgi:hypothetical protein
MCTMCTNVKCALSPIKAIPSHLPARSSTSPLWSSGARVCWHIRQATCARAKGCRRRARATGGTSTMARTRGMPALALVVVAAVAVACAEARLPDYHPSTFTVTGKVQCQDCTKNWNAYAYNAKPIPGSFPFLSLPPCLAGSGAVDTRYIYSPDRPGRPAAN